MIAEGEEERVSDRRGANLKQNSDVDASYAAMGGTVKSWGGKSPKVVDVGLVNESLSKKRLQLQVRCY